MLIHLLTNKVIVKTITFVLSQNTFAFQVQRLEKDCLKSFNKKGHSSKRCFSRRKAKQKVKKPKNSTNTKGPKKIWVSKVKISSNAGVS